MEVLTAGEKIKKLRMELGLTQDDLANEEVSKSLISMIEKNKRGLTYAVATVIAEKLNTYYETMDKLITPEELMESEIDAVAKKIKEGLLYLESLVDQEKVDVKLALPFFNELLTLAKKWNLIKEMMELILLRGRMYYVTFHYTEALEDYSNAIDYYIEEKDHFQVARLYNLMGMANHMILRMDQALTYYRKAYEITLAHNFKEDRIKIFALSNIVLCYRKLREYDKVLLYTKQYKELESRNPCYNKIYEKVLIAEANTYRDIKNYSKAKRLYEKLISMEDDLDKDMLFLAYENYSTMYRVQGKVSLALKQVQKALKLRNFISSKYLPVGFLVQANCLVMLNKMSDAVATLRDGLAFSQNISDNELILQFEFALVQADLIEKNYTKALASLNQIEDFKRQQNIEVMTNDLYSFYAETYCSMGDTKKAISYMSKLRTDYLITKHY